MVNRKLWCTIFLTFVLSTFIELSIIYAQSAGQVAKGSFPSVVLLVMKDENGQEISMGSGFFVSDNIVATNYHVIDGSASGYAKIVGQKAKYDILGSVGIDRRRDLVLLKISIDKAPVLKLGDSKEVEVGDEVYVIGNPLGLEGTFSRGIVSSVREIDKETIFQITAPISPGSSGGPVLDCNGNVIGVAVATFMGGQNLNFAIPTVYLSAMLHQLKAVSSLSTQTSTGGAKSIINLLGEKNTRGVTGDQFTWTYEYYINGNYTFSLRNKLRESVRDIYCIIVFYSRKDNPIDFDMIYYEGIIPGGLAKRLDGKVDGSVQKLASTVEFRILDFRFVD